MGLNWFNSLTENTGRLDNVKSSSEEKDLAASVKKPWIEDYKLLDWGPRGLFPEYLEMGNEFLFNIHVLFYRYTIEIWFKLCHIFDLYTKLIFVCKLYY